MPRPNTRNCARRFHPANLIATTAGADVRATTPEGTPDLHTRGIFAGEKFARTEFPSVAQPFENALRRSTGYSTAIQIPQERRKGASRIPAFSVVELLRLPQSPLSVHAPSRQRRRGSALPPVSHQCRPTDCRARECSPNPWTDNPAQHSATPQCRPEDGTRSHRYPTPTAPDETARAQSFSCPIASGPVRRVEEYFLLHQHASRTARR